MDVIVIVTLNSTYLYYTGVINVNDDMLYWFWILAAFIVTLGSAVFIMRATRKFGFTFGISTLLNVVITGGGVLWLLLGEADDTTNFKLLVYGIACFNLLIIDAFVLLSMRPKRELPTEHAWDHE